VTLLRQGVGLGDHRGPCHPLPFCDSVKQPVFLWMPGEREDTAPSALPAASLSRHSRHRHGTASPWESLWSAGRRQSWLRNGLAETSPGSFALVLLPERGSEKKSEGAAVAEAVAAAEGGAGQTLHTHTAYRGRVKHGGSS